MKREAYTIWQNLWNSRFTCCRLKKAAMCQSMKPYPSELWFYDDYMVHCRVITYYSKNNVRKEYYKFYYKDVRQLLFRTPLYKVETHTPLKIEYQDA